MPLRSRVAPIACCLLSLLAAGAAPPPVFPPDGPTSTAPVRDQDGAGVTVPDQRATINAYQVERLDDERLVRITLRLSYPKTAVESGFGESQATFRVVVPNSAPRRGLPGEIPVAQGAVADLILRTAGDDTEVLVRLNAPVACTAYVVPSEQKVVIEARFAERTAPTDRPTDFGDTPLTLEFIDTDIRVIIDTLMRESGSSIMLRPGVSGTYSMMLREVTLTQALDAVWEAWDLAWKQLDGRIYLVGPESELGDDIVEMELSLPEGWSPADLAAAVERNFIGVAPSRDLSAVPAEGPLPVVGPLRQVGEARRWTARLIARPAGIGPEPPPRRIETLEYYPRHRDPEPLLAELRDRLPELEAELEAELGRLTARGPRELLARARRALAELDVEPDPVIERALWIPLVPVERLTALAAAADLSLQIVHQAEDSTLVYLSGLASKIRVIEDLVEQLKEWQQAGPPAPAPPEAPVPVVVEPETLHHLWPVRYSRADDLARLVAAAVPELALVEVQSQRRPGDPPLAPAVAERESGEFGPTPPWLAGPSPRLVLVGPAPAVARAVALLEAVDIPPAEVELTAVLAELTPEAAATLGLAELAVGQNIGFDPLTGGDMAALLRLLRETPGATVLASPTLRCIDGGTATLTAGDDAAGEAPRYAVRLDLEPTVPGDGSILCRVKPEVRRRHEGGERRGETEVRQLEATIRLADGAVVAVGSLLDGTAGGHLVVLLSARVVGAPGR